MLVALEGAKRSGKTTTCTELVQMLDNDGILVRALTNEELKMDNLAKESRDLARATDADYSHAEEFLIRASRLTRKAQLASDILREDPETVVVVDRFSAWLGAWFHNVRHLDDRLVSNAIAIASQGLKPDLTILLRQSLFEFLRGEGVARETGKEPGEPDRPVEPRSRRTWDLVHHWDLYMAALELEAARSGDHLIIDVDYFVDGERKRLGEVEVAQKAYAAVKQALKRPGDDS